LREPVDKLGGRRFCCVLPGRVAMNGRFRCSARRLISSSLSGRAGLGLEISLCAGAFHQGMMRSPDELVTRFCALWSKRDLDEIASRSTTYDLNAYYGGIVLLTARLQISS
jgi:hypothetical protein